VIILGNKTVAVVLYGRETWSVTVRQQHRLSEFENSLLRRIFGEKRDEVLGGWRKLHIEELHNLYSSPIRIIKPRNKMCKACSTNGEKRNIYKILVGS
jgi:hypothetical protein